VRRVRGAEGGKMSKGTCFSVVRDYDVPLRTPFHENPSQSLKALQVKRNIYID
jgi:hypothetical protein